MEKSHLIQFTLYTSCEGEHNYEKTMRLVHAEDYDKALDKLKKSVTGEVQDPINLTI